MLASAGSFISLFAGVFWGVALLGEQHSSSIWMAVALVAAALALIGGRSIRQPATAR